ncbi:type III secretion system needle length determinant [Pseudomonas sp. BW13M1]|uniref:Type III secretion system needle length determinant n=1 Tax=Pseudomonas peradeniyensis TaxID=2745488 RepID=A0A923GCE7_9PSED|nr:type III secretion system needle length determinant [Pseudomonas peradeniyensis]MBV4507914.1 type III secretion system needle length determinant [Pseudomonas peradeniyensis]
MLNPQPVPALPDNPLPETPGLGPCNEQRLLFEHLLEVPRLKRRAPQDTGHRPARDEARPERPITPVVLNMAALIAKCPPACAAERPALIEDVIERPLPEPMPAIPDVVEPISMTEASRAEAGPQTVRDSTDNVPDRLLPSDIDPILAPLAPSSERPVIDRVLPSTVGAPAQDLQTLVERLQLQLFARRTGTREQTLLQVQLPQLGHVEVRMNPASAGLQVEIQAAPATLRQLQVAGTDLHERLQRLDPAQPVSLGFGANGDSQQGSRNRRHVEDEWWAEP